MRAQIARTEVAVPEISATELRHPSSLRSARRFAARYFETVNRPDLSCIVLRGEGDDFAEVRAATGLAAEQDALIARYEVALNQYADPGFWDDSLPGGALAPHDAGEMARNVLDGKPAFFHRD